METAIALAIVSACVSGVSVIGVVVLGGGALVTSILTGAVMYKKMKSTKSEDTDIKIRKEHEEITDKKNQIHTIKNVQEITIRKDNDEETTSSNVHGKNGGENKVAEGIVNKVLPGILDMGKGNDLLQLTEGREETITTTVLNTGVKIIGNITQGDEVNGELIEN
jgi:hypothetical protein